MEAMTEAMHELRSRGGQAIWTPEEGIDLLQMGHVMEEVKPDVEIFIQTNDLREPAPKNSQLQHETFPGGLAVRLQDLRPHIQEAPVPNALVLRGAMLFILLSVLRQRHENVLQRRWTSTVGPSRAGLECGHRSPPFKIAVTNGDEVSADGFLIALVDSVNGH